MCAKTFRSLALLFSVSLVLAAGCARETEPTTGSGPTPTPRAEKTTLMVFAGAANTPALTELCQLFEKRADCRVDDTFAGSGIVLTQITQEKIGDVYVPGSDDFMERAKEQGSQGKLL